MNGRFALFREYVRDWRTTGSVTPSSRYLVNAMVAPIDYGKARCIVELGAGNGCITRALLRRMRPDTELFAFETNRSLCEILERIEDERLHVINDSAEHIGRHIKTGGYRKADYIVSGLPLVSLPRNIGNSIVDEVQRNLKKEGAYVQFQYSLASKNDFRCRFGEVDIRFIPLNIPPAFVYTCRNHPNKA